MPWILASSGDRTKRNRWVESTPLPACTKTKDPSVSCINLEYLACLSLWPQVPSSETFQSPFIAQKARPEQGGESSVPTHYHQHRPGSGALSTLGAKGPWWVMPLLASQEQFSHHLAGCGSASLRDESWEPDVWSILCPHPPTDYYEPGSVMAQVWNSKRAEIIRGSHINAGFNLMPEILYFWHSPGDAGAVGVTSLPGGLKRS